MTEARVMLVDDDPRILDGFRRHLHRKFDLVTCDAPEQALEALAADGPFGVVVSDYRMPVMDGVQFLTKVRHRSPNTVRVMLTGQADYQATLAAINEGHIYRFLTKPCPVQTLSTTIEDALELYGLVVAEKELLEGTLRGSVSALTELMGLARPEAQARAARIRDIATGAAQRLGIGPLWLIETAAALSQIGCMTITDHVAQAGLSGEAMGERDRAMYESHPQMAARLLARIPRLEAIAALVGAQFVGSLPQPTLDELGLGAEVAELFFAAASFAEAAARLDERTALDALGESFSPPVAEALRAAAGEASSRELRRMSCHVATLRIGMIAVDDISATSGILLVSAGHALTEAMLQRLRNFHASVGVVEPFEVLVPQ